jgi:uncharacterized protein YabE (DUF348 family)
MMKTSKIKKHKLIILVTGLFIFGYGWHVYFNPSAKASDLQNFSADEKNILINENGLIFRAVSHGNTVTEALAEQNISVNEQDDVFPSRQERIFSGSKIIINHAKKITVIEGGNKKTIFTTRTTVEDAIWDQQDINLGEDDLTMPARQTLLKEGMKVTVTHVLIKEETVNKPIDFKTVENEDDDLSWRIKKVTQKGEKGINEVKYKVVYHDSKEISRKILEQNITKKPVDEIVTQGTLVKVGKTHTGAASWYAYTGTMAAANPWLPMGSYVRVTNVENGKSVIVKINDRGPFGNGRIIDLDKVAFTKIAPLGAGVANIKMEVITN